MVTNDRRKSAGTNETFLLHLTEKQGFFLSGFCLKSICQLFLLICCPISGFQYLGCCRKPLCLAKDADENDAALLFCPSLIYDCFSCFAAAEPSKTQGSFTGITGTCCCGHLTKHSHIILLPFINGFCFSKIKVNCVWNIAHMLFTN